ncbi:MAG: type II toxin-antitoxin system prevent-host-death family antitoxin [Myxococcales bacterium]|nr:type II toxin-antitoxin system prevent-host-death family antitoxin [Myxococcales bacterium]
MKRVTTHEAKTHLSKLLAEAERGEEIVILRGTKPAARLVGLGRRAPPKRPKVGVHTSPPVRAAADAFAPLTDEELSIWGIR